MNMRLSQFFLFFGICILCLISACASPEFQAEYLVTYSRTLKEEEKLLAPFYCVRFAFLALVQGRLQQMAVKYLSVFPFFISSRAGRSPVLDQNFL